MSTTLLGPNATTIPRDRWGRPLITNPDTGKQDAYTRVSTLAKTLSDTHALQKWAQRQTAWGVAQRTDLVAAASTVGSDNRDALDAVVEAAMEVAAGASGARLGTAIHTATEQVDLGHLDPANVPDVVRGAVNAYIGLVANLETVDVELFVVNDDLRAAGTTDRLVRLPDGRVIIADLKTSSPDAAKYAQLEWAIQLAVYATSRRYNPETGQRAPLHPDLDPTTGLIIHVPSGDPDKARLHWGNLEWGLEAARLAIRARKARKTQFFTPHPG